MNILKLQEQIAQSQQELYAINLEIRDFDLRKGELETYSRISIHDMESYDCWKYVASYWDHYRQRFVDGKFEKGARVITFANILKYGEFPFAAVMQKILELGAAAMGVPVEIEFAVDLSEFSKGKSALFYVLQIRPMSINQNLLILKEENVNKDEAVLFSSKAMGNGSFDGIRDFVFVIPEAFNSTETQNIIPEIEKINTYLRQKGKNYILIGPGRWGSSDRFLGISVKWDQINAAKLIVETAMNDFQVDFSQGTHFFHNLIAQNSGYMYLDKKGVLDWEWLNSQKTVYEGKYVKHVQADKPVLLELSGVTGLAVVYK